MLQIYTCVNIRHRNIFLIPIKYLNWAFALLTMRYSEPYQKSKIKLLVKLNVFGEIKFKLFLSILDVWQSSEYTPDLHCSNDDFFP